MQHVDMKILGESVKYGEDYMDIDTLKFLKDNPRGAHSRFPGHALTPTGVMAIRCKQFHLPDL